MSSTTQQIESLVRREYKEGFVTDIEADTLPPGLGEHVVSAISERKNEPDFMLDWRLAAYRQFKAAVLVALFITQVFMFYQDQFAALSGLLRVGARGRVNAAVARVQRSNPIAKIKNKLDRIIIGFLVTLLLGFLLVAGGAIFLVVRSLRLGRGDRQGALRIAVAVFILRMLHWTMTGHHTASPGELYLAAIAVCGALTLAVLFWGGYVALEPYVRRLWPESLVSWSRLLAGRFHDPLVGRDILVGFAVSAGLGAVGLVFFWAAEANELIPMLANQGHAAAMQGGRFLIGRLFSTPLSTLAFASALIFLFLILRLITRRTWAALAIMSVLWGLLMGLQWMMLLFAKGLSFGTMLVGFGWGVLMCLVVVGLLVRFGVLALFADFFCSMLVTSFAITADTSAPYFSVSLIGPLVVVLLAVFAYRAAVATRSAVPHDRSTAG